MKMKILALFILIGIHAFTPSAQAFMGTYADCQSQPTPFGPKSEPYQCCVERHFDAVKACRAQTECKDEATTGCPMCKDPVFEIDNCPERA